MIVDAFMWSYELDAVKLRTRVLKGSVDAHVAVQATNTFRGEDREVMMLDLPNVTNIIVTIPEGLDPWESEKWLRDAVLTEAVTLFGTEAVYIVSDGDEIPNPDSILQYRGIGRPMKLMCDYRNFYADWRASEHVLEHQPTIGSFSDYLNAGGACAARWHGFWWQSKAWGWHLSSLGDTSAIKLKTFAHTEYDTPEARRTVKKAKASQRDFLDRFDLEHTDDIPPFTPKHLLGGKI